jgi:chaperonin GroES
MRVKPLQDWVVVQPDEEEEKSAGGIVIPDAAKEQRESGKVVAAGEGRFVEEKDSKGKIKEKKFMKTTLRPGDHILYERYAARRVQVDQEEVILVREQDVLGYLVD